MAKNITIWNMDSSKYDPNNKQKEVAFNDEVDEGLANKANDNAVVKLTGDQTIAWTKTFSSSPIVPTPTTDMEVATKKYVDDNAWWAWLAWWASITWTSWTWLTTTIWNSASSWTIWQSIIIWNTQTNEVTWLSINTGTNNQNPITWILLTTWVGTNSFTQWVTSNTWAWICINTISTWVALSIVWWNNCNNNTYGLMHMRLSNTQSWATVMQKISLWTSTQGHTWLQILANNNSTSIKWISIISGEWVWIDLTQSWWLNWSCIRIWSMWNNFKIWLRTETVHASRAFSFISNNSTTFPHPWTDFSEIDYTKTNTSTSLMNENFNILKVKRTTIQNWTWWTLNAQWSVLKIENVATQTNWTLTDTVAVLSLVQSNTSAWWHILFNTYSWTPTVNNTLWYDGTNFKYIDNAWTTKTITAT